MKKILLTTSAISLFLVFSCKKSDSGSTGGTPAPKTVASLTGTYKLTAQTLSTNGVVVDEYATVLQPCERDNLATLKSDLTYVGTDDGIVCDPPETSTGTWNISSNSDSLVIDNFATFIKSWDGKTLVLTDTEVANSITIISSETLVKQ